MLKSLSPTCLSMIFKSAEVFPKQPFVQVCGGDTLGVNGFEVIGYYLGGHFSPPDVKPTFGQHNSAARTGAGWRVYFVMAVERD
jgi:hypothetical protein